MKVSKFASAAAAATTTSSIPGLFHCHNFLSSSEHESVHSSAWDISKTAGRLSKIVSEKKISPSHNLKSIKKYADVVLPGSECECHHFNDYSIKGHELSYFTKKKIPPFLDNEDDILLYDRIAQLPNVMDIVEKDRLATMMNVDNNGGKRKNNNSQSTIQSNNKGTLKWRLTINRYPSSLSMSNSSTINNQNDNNRRIGFPWHLDLKSNGAVSVIVGLGAPGILEFGLEKETKSNCELLYNYNDGEHPTNEDNIIIEERLKFEKGDAVVLSGMSRWKYLHRVVLLSENNDDCKEEDSNNSEEKTHFPEDERMSLVFGIW